MHIKVTQLCNRESNSWCKSNYPYYDKITPTKDFVPRKNDGRNIMVMFNETIPLEKLSSIKVLFTTEKNSYGIVVNRFMDGEADEIDVEKSTHAAISVKLIKHMYLNTTRQLQYFDPQKLCKALTIKL